MAVVKLFGLSSCVWFVFLKRKIDHRFHIGSRVGLSDSTSPDCLIKITVDDTVY